MARARSERTRSKTQAIDDLTQSIEQLQAFLSKVEDLGREGFPYLEGARARTELQFRECIKRAFGDKSPEFQTYRHHKLSSDTKQTVGLVRNLIATLEDKKVELHGLKPAAPEEATTASEPTRPHMTLVPPSPQTAQVTITSAAATVSPPVTTTVPLATNVEMSTTTVAPATAAPTAIPAPPSAVEPVAPPPPPTAPPAQPKPQLAPIEPISSLFRTQETKPQAQIPQQQVQQPSAPPASPPAPPARFSTTQEVHARPQSAVSTTPSPTAAPRTSGSVEVNHLNITKTLCQRFHFVARQLRLRGEHRSTLEVNDESDVQDLLHALLRLQFDDISTDEWTPGYTNGASRTTFLLNQDRLAIVVKKTRSGLGAKDLADQVRTDIERYRTRGRCTNLFCFVYDPEGRIGNPRGLESDLASSSEHFTVDVLVAPK
jgi:DpnII restriction endonuclease